MDTTIQVHSVDKGRWLMKFTGHEATVVCICVHGQLLASGSSDTTIRLCNKRNGQLLRILNGHIRGIQCLQLGSTWMVSGGTDADIRIWSLEHRSKGPPQVTCKLALDAGAGVTAIAYGGLEVKSYRAMSSSKHILTRSNQIGGYW